MHIYKFRLLTIHIGICTYECICIPITIYVYSKSKFLQKQKFVTITFLANTMFLISLLFHFKNVKTL